MSWGRLFKTQFQTMFHVSTVHVCAFISQFMKLSLIFFGRPLKGCPLKCGAPPDPRHSIFFQSIVWSPSGRKEAWSGCYSSYSIYTERIQGFFSPSLVPSGWNHALFFLKSCRKVVKQNQDRVKWTSEFGWRRPPGSLAWPSKTKNFNGDKSKRTQVATKLAINPKRYDDIKSQCARCVCRKWFTFWWPRDFEWVILHLTVSWFRI